MKQGLFVSEASNAVGFGHLMECLAISEEISNNSFKFHLINSSEKAFALLKNKNVDILEKLPTEKSFDWIFLDTRRNPLEIQEKLFNLTDRLVVLDELGGIKLKCHALINFNIVESWRRYDAEENTEFYFGADYFPLRKSIVTLKHAPFTNKHVLVSLGGVDRTGNTYKIARSMIQTPGITATYVIGPGHENNIEELKKMIGGIPRHDLVVAPENFDEFLAGCEYIVSSGGNTLYEAVFLGKKILVVWEDEHEKTQAEEFQKRGAAFTIGNSMKIDQELLKKLLKNEAGFATDGVKLDGSGAKRIIQILEA